jgi:hypothetical protein
MIALQQDRGARMRKVGHWLATITGGLLLLLVLLYGMASLRGPTDEQNAALALLEGPGPPTGSNGFALVWLLAYEMPDAERESVLAQDVKLFAQRPFEQAEMAAGFTSIAEGRYPKALLRSGDSHYCRWRGEHCLEKVRADTGAYARLIAEDAALLARVGTLADHGYVRSTFAPRLDMPLPAYQQLAYPLAQHAYAFVSGKTDEAMAGVCRDVTAARMMIGSGDNLITSMIGAAMLEGNSTLLADMLAELPADRALPPACTRAFAPAAPEEFSACSTMRGEARFMFAGMRQIPAGYTEGPLQSAAWPLIFDAEKTVARMAPRLAWYCTPPVRTAITLDVPAAEPPATAPMKQTPLQCLDNIVGCILSDLGEAQLTGYQHRLQDARMRLMAMSTLLWLRDHRSDAPITQRLAQTPERLRSTRRPLALAKDGKSVSIPLFDARHAERWSVPLPASRLPASQSR